MSNTYSGERWKQARRQALSRDRVCQDCGTDESLHVHHIRPVRSFDSQEDAHTLDNLVVLCSSCHPEWEGTRARPNLLDAETGLSLTRLVHDLSKDTVGRLMDAPGPWILYRYYVEKIHENPFICDYCFSGLGQSRAEAETCSTCGRPAKLWLAYDRSAPTTDELERRCRRISETLESRGIPIDEAAAIKAATGLWEKDKHYGELKKVTNAAVRVAIREAYETDAVGMEYDPICPMPRPYPTPND